MHQATETIVLYAWLRAGRVIAESTGIDYSTQDRAHAMIQGGGPAMAAAEERSMIEHAALPRWHAGSRPVSPRPEHVRLARRFLLVLLLLAVLAAPIQIWQRHAAPAPQSPPPTLTAPHSPGLMRQGALQPGMGATTIAALPSDLQGAIARSVRRAEDLAYAIQPLASPQAHAGAALPAGSSGQMQYRAANRAQQMAMSFDRSGVHISPTGVPAGQHGMTFRLQSIGRGSAAQSVTAVDPTFSHGTVQYRVPGLVEWYRNGVAGLEQGFTIAHAPHGRATGQPVQLTIALKGATIARSTSTALLLNDGAGRQLRYGALSAKDATGRPLRAWFALGARHRSTAIVNLLVDDRTATYPVTIDPIVQQANLLTSGTPNSNFGWSVSTSDDGNTVVVGDGSNKGAFIWSRAAGTWNEIKLADSGGFAVALAGNGTTAAVASAIYVKSGTDWQQQTELRTLLSSFDGDFGSAVALSSDGNTAIVGARGDSGGIGAAYLFTRAGTTWTYKTEITTPAGEGNGFGKAVAISADAGTLAIGDYNSQNNSGDVLTYLFDGTTATYQATLTEPTPTQNDEFGAGMALSGNGNTVVIGGFGAQSEVFLRTGTSWSHQYTFAQFGRGVGLSQDGNTAVAGQDGGGLFAGSAQVYTRSGGTWTAGTVLTATDSQSGDEFGLAIAVSGDASTAFAGAPNVHSATIASGAVDVFVPAGQVWNEQRELLENNIAQSSSFGNAVALSADGNFAIVGASDVISAFVFARSGGRWSQQAIITPCNCSGGTGDGYAVAINADGTVALIGSIFSTVHFYTRSGSTWSLAQSVFTPGTYRDGFGRAVSISGDGNTALVGAPRTAQTKASPTFLRVTLGSGATRRAS
jgi:FG-GAP repeat